MKTFGDLKVGDKVIVIKAGCLSEKQILSIEVNAIDSEFKIIAIEGIPGEINYRCDWSEYNGFYADSESARVAVNKFLNVLDSIDGTELIEGASC